MAIATKSRLWTVYMDISQKIRALFESAHPVTIKISLKLYHLNTHMNSVSCVADANLQWSNEAQKLSFR